MVDLELLKATIDDRGMSIVKLAEKSGMKRANIYSRFNGRGEFTATEIVGIADALRLTDNERDRIFLCH